MALLLYPFGYLSLKDENKRSMAKRDFWPTLFLALIVCLPFVILRDISFFGREGFLSGIIGLSSALSGFYVAALVAAATLARGSDLDEKIEVGQIFRKELLSEKLERLSRRQYVCALFGYLAFLSFGLSIGLNILTSVASSALLRSWLAQEIWTGTPYTYLSLVSLVGKPVIAFPIAHMFVVTSYGLYYLITRLYEKKPAIVSRVPAKDKAA